MTLQSRPTSESTPRGASALALRWTPSDRCLNWFEAGGHDFSPGFLFPRSLLPDCSAAPVVAPPAPRAGMSLRVSCSRAPFREGGPEITTTPWYGSVREDDRGCKDLLERDPPYVPTQRTARRRGARAPRDLARAAEANALVNHRRIMPLVSFAHGEPEIDRPAASGAASRARTRSAPARPWSSKPPISALSRPRRASYVHLHPPGSTGPSTGPRRITAPHRPRTWSPRSATTRVCRDPQITVSSPRPSRT